MNNISFRNSSKSSTRSGVFSVAVCAMLAATACGKKTTNPEQEPVNTPTVGDANNQTPTTTTGGTTGTTSGGTGGTTTGGTPGGTGTAVIAVDAGRTMPLTFAAFYKNGMAITSYDYCAWIEAHDPSLSPKATHQNLSFYVGGQASGTPLKPGTYPVESSVGPMSIAKDEIGFTGYTEACQSSWPQVVSGTVTIDSVVGGVAKGSVDLQLRDNDLAGSPGTIKGPFTTKPCTGTQVTPPENNPAACPKGSGGSTTGGATTGSNAGTTGGTTTGPDSGTTTGAGGTGSTTGGNATGGTSEN